MHGMLKSAALISLSIAISGCGMGMDHHNNRSNDPASFTSNGERIYFTGVGLDGRPIVTSGGNIHQSMHTRGCAGCHGADRQGGQRMYPFFWVKTPPLTPDALFGEHDDTHGDHENYSSTTLERAIREGIDPSGEALDSAMPRWAMAEQDLSDLVDYLGNLRTSPSF
ncbi:MAG: cytochrome c oxidase subunit 2 [Motiliproteus sp.]|jgi:cytochrome c oxidase subunit 2